MPSVESNASNVVFDISVVPGLARMTMKITPLAVQRLGVGGDPPPGAALLTA